MAAVAGERGVAVLVAVSRPGLERSRRFAAPVALGYDRGAPGDFRQ